MPISDYYVALRRKHGHDLLLISAVAAVVHDAEGQILVQERPDGGFSLPAGAIEPGEQPAQTIAREVYEETGLTVRPKQLLGVFGGQPVRYANGDAVEYLVCLFACEIISGDLRCLDGESASVRLFPPDDVPPPGFEYPRNLSVRDIGILPFQWDDKWLRGDSPAPGSRDGGTSVGPPRSSTVRDVA